MNRTLGMPKWQKDEDVSTETYARFVVEPLERGYGATVGNSLRRVLLSSLEGAAITAVRIEGVQHEFGSIPGVVEDVTEVVLNLKSVRLKMHGTAEMKNIQITTSGKKEIAAAALAVDEEIEILNPDQHILTLNQGSKLVMDLEIGRGRGYTPADQNKRDNHPIGTISIDSVFSPVEKMNFTVESARVGQMTDYDKLILEIWTNSSILPEDALAAAARILIRHFNIFVKSETDEEMARTSRAEVLEEARKYLDKSVNELELSVRAANCLRAANIKTIAELVQKSEAEMLKYRNFGKKSLDEIRAVLVGMNLRFGMKLDGYQPTAAPGEETE
ncbi:MAG: DNA-directed RNA polymerase subunit alpha [Candidatus Abyssobacteria bacterium SURF_17]|uniref:DNA-directed RNA polymerase subunit alpha n=1 Tax=Candidatus Abyssobacteria bacterium SURF_17 TaxID=2093361 RepID=A0A419EVK6_9BACT|nr:MAG: DNA-directed RNA polymerase subunit alpha [Candidatus Abyssubacteria bacterium SURF_17]